MTYIERLLQRQSQMAARLERQNAPALRLYPDEVWLDAARTAQATEDEALSGGAELSQENAEAEELYRQLVQLETVQERRAHMVLRQAQENQALTPQTQVAAQTAAVASAHKADASVQEVQRQGFGLLPQSRASQISMERISRFFERDARRYGG